MMMKLRIEIPQDDDPSSETFDSSGSGSLIDSHSSEIDGSYAEVSKIVASSNAHGRSHADWHVRTASGSLTWMPPSPIAVKSPHANAIKKMAAMADGRARAMESAWAEAEEEAETVLAAAAAAVALPGDSSESSPSRSHAKPTSLFGLKAPSFPLTKPYRITRTSSGISGAGGGESPNSVTRTWSISSLPSIWRKSPRGSPPKGSASSDLIGHDEISPVALAGGVEHQSSCRIVRRTDRVAFAREDETATQSCLRQPRQSQQRRVRRLSRSLTSDGALLASFDADEKPPLNNERTMAARRAPEASPAKPDPIRNPHRGGFRALVRTASAPVSARAPSSLPRIAGRDEQCEMGGYPNEAERQGARSCAVAPVVEEEEEEDNDEIPVVLAATATGIGSFESRHDRGAKDGGCLPHAWAHMPARPAFMHAAHGACRQRHSPRHPPSLQSPPVESHAPQQRQASSQIRRQQQQARARLPPSPSPSPSPSPTTAVPAPSSHLPRPAAPPAAQRGSQCMAPRASASHPLGASLPLHHAPPRVLIPRLASSPSAYSPHAHSPSPAPLTPPTPVTPGTPLTPPCLRSSATAPTMRPRSCLRSSSSSAPPSSTRSHQARRVAFSPVVRVRTYSLSDHDWPAPLSPACHDAPSLSGGDAPGMDSPCKPVDTATPSQ
ncbi:unnamed protein product [Closterium sp. Yama58-4]|nr:unnamed protein product [Closterium sp. Yama58-4]